VSRPTADPEPCFVCEGTVVFSEEYAAFGTVRTLHEGWAWVDFGLLGSYWTTEEFVRPAVWRRGRWT
jgi:hypothetical protein